MAPRAPSAVLVAAVLSVITSPLAAADFTGRCVGVTDGDTISVMRDGKAVKVRLEGIDCPERKQDFGTKAKQATSDLVFGKDVRVVDNGTDRYKRTIGRVFVGETDVNLELVRAGLAWHYKAYSSEAALAKAEAGARTAQRGLWTAPSPTAPWDFRRGSAASRSEPAVRTSAGEYHGNRKSRAFHRSTCQHFDCKNCTRVFDSPGAAITAGFRPCGSCKP